MIDNVQLVLNCAGSSIINDVPFNHPFCWYDCVAIPSSTTLRASADYYRPLSTGLLLTNVSNVFQKVGAIQAVNIKTGKSPFDSTSLYANVGGSVYSKRTEAAKGIYMAPFAFAAPKSIEFSPIVRASNFNASYAVCYMNEPLGGAADGRPQAFSCICNTILEFKLSPSNQALPQVDVFADILLRERIFNFMAGKEVIYENPSHLAFISKLLRIAAPHIAEYAASSKNKYIRNAGRMLQALEL